MFSPVIVLEVRVPDLLLTLPESSTFRTFVPLPPITNSGPLMLSTMPPATGWVLPTFVVRLPVLPQSVVGPLMACTLTVSGPPPAKMAVLPGIVAETVKALLPPPRATFTAAMLRYVIPPPVMPRPVTS